MYVSEHLKWRILIAQALKSFHFERENANRNLKRVFETFGKYLLGTTYDTFLNYLNKEKYDISKLKLPPYILIALKLLDAIRLACDRLHARRPNASWTLTAIVEEVLAVVREKETEHCTAPQKLDTFGVFFMKYNYEIRLKAVKLVLEGGLSVREAGCHLGCGRSQVHLWVTLFERHGLAGLKLRHGSYSAEFKLSVLKHMHQNHLSLLETAVHFGIPGPFVIRQWERLYQNQGAEGLRRKPQRRRPAMSKSKTKKVKLKTTPHEELLKELEYLRAENAYLKKLQALVEERIVRESGKEPKPSKD